MQRNKSKKKGVNLGQIVAYPVFHIMTAGFKQDITCKVINAGLYTQKARKKYELSVLKILFLIFNRNNPGRYQEYLENFKQQN